MTVSQLAHVGIQAGRRDAVVRFVLDDGTELTYAGWHVVTDDDGDMHGDLVIMLSRPGRPLHTPTEEA